ncbi:MAG: glycosyltransferase [Clostridiales bacterium]|nr:MAG: glycosyltransferase [Clostridiales bacterium]
MVYSRRRRAESGGGNALRKMRTCRKCCVFRKFNKSVSVFFYKSDIVLVPSYSEAAPMVFNEAEALGTYIFTTDTASANEMVGDKNIGFVCGKYRCGN